MKKIGTWNGIEVVSIKKQEFDNMLHRPEGILYLIDDKYLVRVDNGDCSIIGQLEPDQTIFEYAEVHPYYIKKEKPKVKSKNKYTEEECPVKMGVEYETVEINLEDLISMSAGIDAFLLQASKSVAYEDIMFKGEV